MKAVEHPDGRRERMTDRHLTNNASMDGCITGFRATLNVLTHGDVECFGVERPGDAPRLDELVDRVIALVRERRPEVFEW